MWFGLRFKKLACMVPSRGFELPTSLDAYDSPSLSSRHSHAPKPGIQGPPDRLRRCSCRCPILNSIMNWRRGTSKVSIAATYSDSSLAFNLRYKKLPSSLHQVQHKLHDDISQCGAGSGRALFRRTRLRMPSKPLETPSKMPRLLPREPPPLLAAS